MYVCALPASCYCKVSRPHQWRQRWAMSTRVISTNAFELRMVSLPGSSQRRLRSSWLPAITTAHGPERALPEHCISLHRNDSIERHCLIQSSGREKPPRRRICSEQWIAHIEERELAEAAIVGTHRRDAMACSIDA